MSGRWPGSGRLHAALCVARRLPAARPSTRHCPTWYSRRGRRRLMRWCFPPLGSPPRLLWAAQCGAHWQPGTRAARWVQRTCISACGAGCVCLTRCDRCAVLAASACSACAAPALLTSGGRAGLPVCITTTLVGWPSKVAGRFVSARRSRLFCTVEVWSAEAEFWGAALFKKPGAAQLV
jgi:hypothetical protein